MTDARTLGSSPKFPLGAFALLMLLDVAGQLVEKQASIDAAGDGAVAVALAYLAQPWVWIVIAIKLGQLFTWTAILRRVAISLAFPLTALAYPLTMTAAVVLFHERLGWRVWAGGALVTVGAIVMGTGEPSDGVGDELTEGAPRDPPPGGPRGTSPARRRASAT